MSVESPESIERKIQSLDTSFEALGRSYSSDLSVQAEITRFRQWRDDVRSSLTSSFFPSTIAPEFENWQNRYRLAFENARKAYPDVKPIAPSPEAVVGPSPATSPWIYAMVAGSVALGLLAIAWIRK